MILFHANVELHNTTARIQLAWCWEHQRDCIIRGVPYTFSMMHDCKFYFSVIRDSWYKTILCPHEFKFGLFRERTWNLVFNFPWCVKRPNNFRWFCYQEGYRGPLIRGCINKWRATCKCSQSFVQNLEKTKRALRSEIRNLQLVLNLVFAMASAITRGSPTCSNKEEFSTFDIGYNAVALLTNQACNYVQIIVLFFWRKIAFLLSKMHQSVF